jgi:hypothetical protein
MKSDSQKSLNKDSFRMAGNRKSGKFNCRAAEPVSTDALTMITQKTRSFHCGF